MRAVRNALTLGMLGLLAAGGFGPLRLQAQAGGTQCPTCGDCTCCNCTSCSKGVFGTCECKGCVTSEE